jgi:hypothetical protein
VARADKPDLQRDGREGLIIAMQMLQRLLHPALKGGRSRCFSAEAARPHFVLRHT